MFPSDLMSSRHHGILCLFVPFFLLGLQQQGIFRVPGSQVEVNDIKNSFERGRCRVSISSLCPEEARMGGVCLRVSSVPGLAHSNISFQVCVECLHLSSLKSAKAGVFTPQKLANAKIFSLSFSLQGISCKAFTST